MLTDGLLYLLEVRFNCELNVLNPFSQELEVLFNFLVGQLRHITKFFEVDPDIWLGNLLVNRCCKCLNFILHIPYFKKTSYVMQLRLSLFVKFLEIYNTEFHVDVVAIARSFKQVFIFHHNFLLLFELLLRNTKSLISIDKTVPVCLFHFLA